MGHDLRMRIVVLDSNPAFGCDSAEAAARGTLDTAALSELGDVVIHAGTKPDEIVARCEGAAVVLTNKVVLGPSEISALPKLRLISVLATGVNVIDLDAARAHGVTVCNVPGYSTMSTAQHALALLLELTNHVGLHASHVASGGWQGSEAFSYFRTPLKELAGDVMGVVGYGAIGKQVIALAQALGMQVLVNSRTVRTVDGVVFVDKETLLRKSDVISLHCPLTDETRHFIDGAALSQMKPGALLINVARGPIVDEEALAQALLSGQIAGAATDVLTSEPPRSDCPLLREDVLSTGRCLVTPHVAWATHAARTRLLDVTTKNIDAFLRGAPQNVVS